MIRSKSRSRSSEIGRKSHKSVLSRTLSASRFCRGDPLISQIDANALKPVEQNPSDTPNLSEHRIAQMEEELKNVKEQLNVMRNEKDRTLEELRETKMAAREGNTKPTEVPSPMIGEVLKMKEKEIKSLKLELKKARGLDIEREAKTKIQELEDELERLKLKERKMYEMVSTQTKKFEGTKVELEESKYEVASLRQAIAKLMALHRERNSGTFEEAYNHESVDGEQKNTNEEIISLKNELKLAIEAEEKSNKAMEDLALALKEVATEANQANEKLGSMADELERAKNEATQLKEMVRTIEDRYEKQLEDANNEIERYKNNVERLVLESEESHLAWNDKEMSFMNCIKKAEENNTRLAESLNQAEKLTKTSKEENLKLRDILKQALNEANVAKEAANLARIENSQLKDTQLEKDEALDRLAQENERLNESVKELKHLLSMPSKNEKIDKNPIAEKKENGHKKSGDFRSTHIGELKISNGHKDEHEEVLHEDPAKAEALRGSIFDNVVSPISEPRMPQHKRVPSPYEDKINSEGMDHKGRALFRKWGDLIKRKNLIKKESSVE